MSEADLMAVEGGQLLITLCNGLVGLFREFAGRGPSKCKAHWAGRDLIVVILRGGFTTAEQTLYEAGQGMAVRDSQHALSDVLEMKMTELVQNVTARKVQAFMSASHQDPDLRALLFVLEPLEQ
ncbi:MAG TPA: Na-translocating system protein MpsC family protein [Solirubrobacteraceae bacterium]